MSSATSSNGLGEKDSSMNQYNDQSYGTDIFHLYENMPLSCGIPPLLMPPYLTGEIPSLIDP